MTTLISEDLGHGSVNKYLLEAVYRNLILQKVGMKHPDSAKLLRLLGNSFYLMGDLATSEKLLNK